MIIIDSDSARELFEYLHQSTMLSQYQDDGFGKAEVSIDYETNRQVVSFVYEGYDDFYDEE